MKKYIAIATLLLITSCNTTRDVVKESLDKKKETSIVAEEKKDVNTKVVVDLISTEEEDGCIYEPVYKNEPMIIKGVSYRNVKISSAKKKKFVTEKSTVDIVDNTVLYEKKEEKETVKQNIKKTHKKTTPSWLTWLWWIALIAAAFVARKVYRYKY